MHGDPNLVTPIQGCHKQHCYSSGSTSVGSQHVRGQISPDTSFNGFIYSEWLYKIMVCVIAGETPYPPMNKWEVCNLASNVISCAKSPTTWLASARASQTHFHVLLPANGFSHVAVVDLFDIECGGILWLLGWLSPKTFQTDEGPKIGSKAGILGIAKPYI